MADSYFIELLKATEEMKIGRMIIFNPIVKRIMKILILNLMYPYINDDGYCKQIPEFQVHICRIYL